jgi:hypothetical protein
MTPAKKIPVLIFSLTLLLGSLFLSTSSFSQTSPAAKDSSLVTDDEMKVFEKVEIEASYPGGDNAWRRFLEQNLNGQVAADKGAPAGVYTVIIQFVVDKDGKISTIVPLTSHGYGMEAEVMRLLRKAPKWNPAIQDGRPVKAYRKQPVTFMVTDKKNKRKKD